MYPLLYENQTFTVYSYGVFVALGFACALATGMYFARRHGANLHRFRDACLIGLLIGIAGARFLHVAITWDFYAANPAQILLLWRGGFVYYGGFVAGALGSYLYLLMLGEEPLGFMDLAAPGLALGQAIGRIGCFLTGCCFGCETSPPLAVVFTDPRGLARLGEPLHPVQLYEAALCFALFAALARRLIKRGPCHGEVFALYLMGYAGLRFVLEFFRGDPRGFLGPFSTSQLISAGVMLVGVALYRNSSWFKHTESKCAP